MATQKSQDPSDFSITTEAKKILLMVQAFFCGNKSSAGGNMSVPLKCVAFWISLSSLSYRLADAARVAVIDQSYISALNFVFDI